MKNFWKKVSLVLILQAFLLTAWACQDQIHYPSITNCDDSNIEFLLDQAENFLLSGDLIAAKNNFSSAIQLCSLSENQQIRLCRGLLNRSLTNASLGLEFDALSDLEELNNNIQFFKCRSNQLNSEYFAGGKPILGEDTISTRDCIERVENTIGYIKDLIGLAPVSITWKASFITSLYLIEDRARQCCRSGGVWKACLQPLLTKWIELKEWERECSRTNHWYTLD